MYMTIVQLEKQLEIPVRPEYVWQDDLERGLVLGRKAKTVFSNLLARCNPELRTELMMCDPNHRLGKMAMNKQEERRLNRLFDPGKVPTHPDVDPDKLNEISGIVTHNRLNRFKGLGLEPGAMLVGPIVLGEVIDWSRDTIQSEFKIAPHNQTTIQHAIQDYETIMQV